MQNDGPDQRLGILHQAAETVAQRRQQYGTPAEHFEQVARRWSRTLGTSVSAAQVVLCLIELKLARLAVDPQHQDSLVDLIGYSVILHELLGDVSAEAPAEVAELAEPTDAPGLWLLRPR